MNLSCLKNRRYYIVTVLALSIILAGFFCFLARSKITGSPIESDAVQNLSFSYNLAMYNSFADSQGNPTNYREPLTPFVASLWIKFHPDVQANWTFEDFKKDNAARIVKLSNLFWLFFLLLAVFWSTFLLTQGIVFSFLAVALSNAFLPPYLNRLLTEIPTASLLVCFSLTLILIARKDAFRSFFLLAGMIGGSLALTRSVFLYIIPVIFVLIPFFLWKTLTPNALIKKTIIALFGFSLMVAPWMLRNYILLNHFAIAERGGAVLYLRALYNSMSTTEIKGALYHWAPLGKRTLGKIWGFSSRDLEEGGALERLNRSLPNSIYRSWGTERGRLRRFNSEQGFVNPSTEADKHLQKKAIAMIVQSPFRHIAMTVPFFWRGIPRLHGSQPWSRALKKTVPFSIAQIILLFLFFLMPIYALITKKHHILFFSMPGWGMLSFYALFSHNIPRYNEPIVPLLLISFIFFVHVLIFKIKAFLFARWSH